MRARRAAGHARLHGGRRLALIPLPDLQQQHHCDQRHQREPGDARLSARHDDECCQQGSERLAGLPADLEQGLSKTVAAARGHAGHARRLGVKDRRAGADERSPEQQHGKAPGVRQHDQADQRAPHAGNQ